MQITYLLFFESDIIYTQKKELYMNRLKEIRIESQKYQKEIASILNVSQPQYVRYETGENKMPIEKYIKLAKFYDTSIDYLACLTDEKKP